MIIFPKFSENWQISGFSIISKVSTIGSASILGQKYLHDARTERTLHFDQLRIRVKDIVSGITGYFKGFYQITHVEDQHFDPEA